MPHPGVTHSSSLPARIRVALTSQAVFATCFPAEARLSMNVQCQPEAIAAAPLPRRQSVGVDVGGVMVGGAAPIVVQSMTNTDTADIEGTAQQVAALARAGSELVRITVDRDEAAAA